MVRPGPTFRPLPTTHAGPDRRGEGPRATRGGRCGGDAGRRAAASAPLEHGPTPNAGPHDAGPPPAPDTADGVRPGRLAVHTLPSPWNAPPNQQLPLPAAQTYPTVPPLPPRVTSVWLSFVYRALDSHPFFPSHVASGRCVLSAAAAGAPAGVVSAFAEPSSWCAGAVRNVAGCAV